jgi:LuxR family transcriptional activator of bioluminescence operon
MGSAAAPVDSLAGVPVTWRRALAAAARADDAQQPLRALLRDFGFDGLSAIVLAPAAGGRERVCALWCTRGAAWRRRYRDLGLCEHDPRVTLTRRRLSPIIWDAPDLAGDAAVLPFVAEAAREGIRCGVSVAFRDGPVTRTVVAFDSARSPIGEVRCAAMIAALGDLMLLAAAAHEVVLAPRFASLSVPGGRAAHGLTRRERECLHLASRGLTSGDMGSRLGIAERTVNFHMQNLLRKLQAQNRSEAIARAVARGVLQAGGGA